MAQQVFTNCETCCFYKPKLDKDKYDSCDIGKRASKGFAGKVSGEDVSLVMDRLCQFHRSKEWEQKQQELGIPIKEAVKEVRLKYALICSLSVLDHSALISTIKYLAASELPPSSLYVIDNRAGLRAQEYNGLLAKGETIRAESVYNELVDQSALLVNELTQLKLKLTKPFKLKRVLGQRLNSASIDEFVTTGGLKDPFYISLADTDFDFSFIEGLDELINHDMQQVMFAGDSSYYFIPTRLHEVVKSGFKQFLISQNLENNVYGYKELCDN